MARKGQTPLSERDEAIREAIQTILGMSVPKYISITYGRSQKAAQIMFNQPETRKDRDEELLDEIFENSRDADRFLTHFIAHILGSDERVLSNIQTTIDSRFQLTEAENTIRSLSRPMLSEIPEVNQIEMVNDKYFYAALDMQRAWADAKKKQEDSDAPVRIPHTHEQIRHAFQTVIDMARLVIDLKLTDDSPRARETKARAYALLAAAAIQMGRYDIVEQSLAEWRDRFELHNDENIPLRVRNLLFQKELWLRKRKGEFAAGLKTAEQQWSACATDAKPARWMEVEPLACIGLELAALEYRTQQNQHGENSAAAVQAQATVLRWLERFDHAPDRTEEIGHYLNTDPELEAVREKSTTPPVAEKWSELMKKFGMLALVLAALTLWAALVAGASPDVNLAAPAGPVLDSAQAFSAADCLQAGANPGKIVMDLLRWIFAL
ncbi:MAG: hypothetical protein P9L99_04295 [Candidatus Lernaella stagnicola]|nr:hypothetical protein [Candidatus Lernaella stagnicola]